MYSVYQHWDPLKTCVVGRTYPPEFYDWIKDSKVRTLFEKIALETEEDLDNIEKTLQGFGVKTLRPKLPTKTFLDGSYVPPPMTPRDYMVMVGEDFWHCFDNWENFYHGVWQTGWPAPWNIDSINDLPVELQKQCYQQGWNKISNDLECYSDIWEHIQAQGNQINQVKFTTSNRALMPVNGAMISRIGKDLYFGAIWDGEGIDKDYLSFLNQAFPTYRNHMIEAEGHTDGCFCPVAPGLIFSINDMPTYEKTFPGWEVVYLPDQSWDSLPEFMELKNKNGGKWWIPGYEKDADVINFVEQWLNKWVGYVEETVFDVNMLVVDPKNVLVFNYNEKVFEALDRYGITPHITPLRHRYFWDGGIHCVTLDLDREGDMKDFFPGRTCIK